MKKPRGLRCINLNPLFKVKLHGFTWLFFSKDLLSNTYNLIHIRDTTKSCCSIVDPSTTLKGQRFSPEISKNQSLNERSRMVWHFRFLPRKPSLENNMRFLTNLQKSLWLLNPLRVNREVFIGKCLKNLGFGRFLNWNCVKNLTENAWPLEPTHGPLEHLGCLGGMAYLSSPTLFQKPNLNHFKFKKKKWSS